MLPGAAHAVAREDGSRGEFGQLGDVVVGQAGGCELDERSRRRRQGEDLRGGQHGVVGGEGADVDARAGGGGQFGVLAAGGGGEVRGRGEALVPVEEDPRTGAGRRDREGVPCAVREGGGVLHVQGEGHGVRRSFEEERSRADGQFPADGLGTVEPDERSVDPRAELQDPGDPGVGRVGLHVRHLFCWGCPLPAASSRGLWGRAHQDLSDRLASALRWGNPWPGPGALAASAPC